MALVRKGAAYRFGISGFTCPGVIVTNADVSVDATTNIVIADAQGLVKTQILGNQKATLRMDGFTTSGTLPDIGTKAEGAGETGYVVSSRITASNEDFQRISLSAEAYAF